MSQTPFELTPEQLSQFDNDGYLILPSFFTKEIAQKLLERSQTLLSEFSLEGHPLTTFTTAASKRHIGDDYFLTSGDKIRYFFEEGAVDPETGELNRPKERAVNKIGHALHEKDEVFREFTLENEGLKGLVQSLGRFKDPRVIQSMVICKQPAIGGAVHSHDDSTFLYTSPLSAVGLWFALEDCTVSNGCLSFVKGSHKVNEITKRLVRVDGGKGGTEIVEWPRGRQDKGKEWDKDENVVWTEASCKAGDLVLIHGSVIHRSEKNLSDKSRFIYTFHMIEGEAEWDELNWLQPTSEMPFTKFAV